ncbi:MAG: type IX secretion system PorP/SprF family membrane protein [Polaribacter sp.]|jgi:type IX secretion system PorP/SprF family membrane protein
MKKNYLQILFFCLLVSTGLQSQDIHYSQYYNSPLNISPALTGMYNGDMRFMGNYRDQWSSVPVDYRTYTAAFDMKYFHKKLENGFFGGGIVLNTDKAGDSELGMTQVALSGAYTQRLNDNNMMTAGFQFGVGQRSFSLNALKFENQWNGDVYEATAGTGENFSNTSVAFVDVGAGFNWRLQFDEGLRRLDIGVGAFHLNKPQQKFYEGGDVALPMRLSFYASGEAEVNELWSVVFHGIAQFQGPNKEGITGTGVKYWLNKARGKEMAIQLGTAYRFFGRSDAVIPSVELQYLAWKFGLSYDINLSDFDVATNSRGGLELSLIYIITKVKPTKEIKACPVF